MNTFPGRYEEFFTELAAFSPYPYQVRLAQAGFGDLALKIPTGAGKTLAVLVAWMWGRRQGMEGVPRRLVYCLPMRTLVEQTAEVADMLAAKGNFCVHRLMGGEMHQEWDGNPERDAVIIGTQDMLLSRALNRGYAMSRSRWPLHFGLLNNDCLWVVDETQLMGAGLGTTAQLAAFRAQFGGCGPRATWWMSATLREEDLGTVDWLKLHPAPLPTVELTEEDRADERLKKRLCAEKRVVRAVGCETEKGLAEYVAAQHTAGSRSLVIVNRVKRAVGVFQELRKRMPVGFDLRLMHSRFRPAERGAWGAWLKEEPGPGGRILVATQVVEAGLDLTSKLLVTDLAPYPSMVQRFGRCNRAGDDAAAEVHWVDLLAGHVEDKKQVEACLPYEVSDLKDARERLKGLESAESGTLPEAGPLDVKEIVLRRRDLLDLFDTTPDLTGLDTDVSRFIRSGRETDVYVAWRDLGEGADQERNWKIEDRELCPVPIGEMKDFRNSKKRRLLRWSQLDGLWVELKKDDPICPGTVLLADPAQGGYLGEAGWAPKSTMPVEVVGSDESPDDQEDPLSTQRRAQTLQAHSAEVSRAMDRLVRAIGFVGEFAEQLTRSALVHDLGKTHPVFQRTMYGRDLTEGMPLLAKSTLRGRHERPHFRHELATALALMHLGEEDLVAYLAAAHHGRVRMSIRSFPGESSPGQEGRLFARGIWAGDELPALDLGAWRMDGPLVLDLEPMLMGLSADGRRSWVDRAIELRDRLGVFRLAYLEALVRVADERASANPVEVLP